MGNGSGFMLVVIGLSLLHPASPISVWTVYQVYYSKRTVRMRSNPKRNAASVEILMPEYNHFCQEHFVFYQRYSNQQKILFINRMLKVYKEKLFFSAEGFELTEAKKLVIAGTICRLTLGIKKHYSLPKFKAIEIYPSVFYSRLIEHHVKGLTMGVGKIMMSWSDFHHGNSDDDDKINLGLHEFAHALMIQFFHFDRQPGWNEFMLRAKKIMADIHSGKNTFFRAYGGTNLVEFWAVAVECFFEAPDEFAARHPELYTLMTKILHQDLRNSTVL